jgi:hypothetical protein
MSETDANYIDLFAQRDEEQARTEMRAATTAMEQSLAELAATYPGVIMLGTCFLGHQHTLVVAPCCGNEMLMPREAMDRAHTLATVISRLPVDLRDVIRMILNAQHEKRQIQSEMEVAVAAALKAAHEKRSE